ncbi:MAG: GNAT family N-acetyltransferase [Aeoliella sp.]
MFPNSIETERLLLSQPKIADAGAIYRVYGHDPRVTRHLSWSPQRSIADAEKFLRELAKRIKNETEFAWAITDRSTDELCGMIGLILNPPGATMGYCLAHEVWGRGLATEAARAIVPLVWKHPQLQRLEAYCHTEHLRSARVLEKAGLRYVSIAREQSVLPAHGLHAQDMLRYRLERPHGC